MGNTPSKTDHKPEQHSEQGMREIGLEFNKKYPIGGPFFIEGQEPKYGIYGFQIYHVDILGFHTEIFTFETFHPLKKEFKVVYDGSIVKFIFETDSFEKGQKHIFEYSFDFSKSFHSEKDSNQKLKLSPFLLHPYMNMTYLKGKYWYYMISSWKCHELYLVEAYREKHGFNSTFQIGDTVITKIIVDSLNVPFVMNDKDGNPIIASADEKFDPIPIQLPIDDISSR